MGGWMESWVELQCTLSEVAPGDNQRRLEHLKLEWHDGQGKLAPQNRWMGHDGLKPPGYAIDEHRHTTNILKHDTNTTRSRFDQHGLLSQVLVVPAITQLIAHRAALYHYCCTTYYELVVRSTRPEYLLAIFGWVHCTLPKQGYCYDRGALGLL